MYSGSKRGVIAQFDRYSLYLDFEPETWTGLTDQVKPTLCRRGEIIRPGGDTSARITIMLSGIAQVGTVLQSGRGIVTHLIGPGAVWGMPSAYADDVSLPTRTSLTAVTECTVCHVPRHTLLQWVEQDHWNYEQILHHECRKSLVFVQHIELLSIPTMRCRISTLLLSLCSSVGEDCAEGLRIPLRLTHQQIADIVHSDRVTVARIISELVKSGLVVKLQGCLVLLDVHRLCDVAMGLG